MASEITNTCINSNNKPRASFLGDGSACGVCEREKGNVMPESIEDICADVETAD